MPRFTSLLLLLCLMSAGSLQAGEWKMLFDGSTLEGWTQKNGTATYRVEKGTIVGQTSEGSPNSFLCSNQEYGDFELEFSVKVHDRLNSGVQIRSQAKPPQMTRKNMAASMGPRWKLRPVCKMEPKRATSMAKPRGAVG